MCQLTPIDWLGGLAKQNTTMLLRTSFTRLACVPTLGRGLSTSSRLAIVNSQRKSDSTPWFVDANDELPHSSRATVSPDASHKHPHARPIATPPPAEAPAPLHALHAHLASLPLLKSVSVLHASALENLRGSDVPLPTQRPHGKRKRGGSSFGGVGVGDPPPVWNWVLQAEVKEGAEKRGAVNAVIRSAIKVVSRYIYSYGCAY